MPFKSEKQRRLCWVLYHQDIKAGKTPKWNCRLWDEETKKLKKKKTKLSLVLM